MAKAGTVRGAAALVCLVAVACGRIDDGETSANRMRGTRHVGGTAGSTDDATGALPYLGRWYGTTSQGLSFAFTVDDGDPAAGITAITYAWQLPSCSHHDEIRFEEPATIHDGALTIQVEATGS